MRSGEANLPSRAREPKCLIRTCLDASTPLFVLPPRIMKTKMRHFATERRVVQSSARRTNSHGLCPQFVDDLSRDPMVMFENVDHVSITSTGQNAFKEGNDIILFSLPGFQYSFLFAETHSQKPREPSNFTPQHSRSDVGENEHLSLWVPSL